MSRDKDFLYNKNPYIIDDYKKDYLKKIEKNKIYSKYYDIDSFSDLFNGKKRQSSQTTVSPQLTQQQINMLNQMLNNIQGGQNQSQTSVSQHSNTTSSTTGPQGRIVDPTQMWSPISWAGRIYEWDRGVFAVAPNGQILKGSLDGTPNHHADKTADLAQVFGIYVDERQNPFIAGTEAAAEGLVIFQSEGDNGFVYFPDSITEEQGNRLATELLPRQGFNFSYAHGEEIFEDQTLREVLTHVADMVYGPRAARR